MTAQQCAVRSANCTDFRPLLLAVILKSDLKNDDTDLTLGKRGDLGACVQFRAG